jgi:hypothetical protein
MRTMNGFIAAGVVALLAGSASADSLTGSYSSSFTQTVALTVQGWNIGPSNNFDSRQFNWSRSDLPAGMGVDSTIPASFVGYCVEINQPVPANTQVGYEVVTPASFGYNANQILLLSRLWGEYANAINSSVMSAAFQLSIYEVAYDGDGPGINLDTGDFIVQNVGSTFAVKIAAQTMLGVVTAPNYAGGVAPIAVLTSPTAQDQLVRVPAPASGALAVVGAGLIARRRRNA